MPSDTPVPFSPEEAAAIRQMLAVSEATVVCPKCRGALTIKGAAAAGSQRVWELRCGYCRRSMIVTELKP